MKFKTRIAFAFAAAMACVVATPQIALAEQCTYQGGQASGGWHRNWTDQWGHTHEIDVTWDRQEGPNCSAGECHPILFMKLDAGVIENGTCIDIKFDWRVDAAHHDARYVRVCQDFGQVVMNLTEDAGSLNSSHLFIGMNQLVVSSFLRSSHVTTGFARYSGMDQSCTMNLAPTVGEDYFARIRYLSPGATEPNLWTGGNPWIASS